MQFYEQPSFYAVLFPENISRFIFSWYDKYESYFTTDSAFSSLSLQLFQFLLIHFCKINSIAMYVTNDKMQNLHT